MDPLEKQTKLVLSRIFASALLYAVFVALSVAGVMTRNETILFWVPIVAIVAIFVLPRHTTPERMPAEDSEPLERLRRMKLWLSYLRVAYLLLALFILFGLPRLIA